MKNYLKQICLIGTILFLGISCSKEKTISEEPHGRRVGIRRCWLGQRIALTKLVLCCIGDTRRWARVEIATSLLWLFRLVVAISLVVYPLQNNSKMAKWFRSEPMEYISIIMNEDAAHECLSTLGNFGAIQFTDVRSPSVMWEIDS